MDVVEFIETSFVEDLFISLFTGQIREDLNLPLEEEHLQPLVMNQFEIFIKGTRHNYPLSQAFVISCNENAAGLLIFDSSTGHIIYLMIRPSYRRQGLAGQAVKDLAGEQPLSLNVLKSNQRAIRFYESMNFEIYSDDETHWLMKCT